VVEISPDLARERIAQAIAFARDSNNTYDLAAARTMEPNRRAL
jgi:hypothetical protein